MMLSRLAQAPPPSRFLPHSWLLTLGWLAGTRLVIALIGFVGVAMFVDHHSLTIGGPAALDYQGVWHKWDSLWYERIAVHGYAYEIADLRGQAAAAFFPLYPVTVGLLLALLPFASFFWVGSAASTLFTFAALLLAVRHLARDAAQARQFLLITTASAGSFYLSIPYTEGLFLLLVVLVLIATRRNQLVLAALLAGLGAVTRAHGLALIAVPAVAGLLDRGRPPASRVAQLGMMALAFALPIAVYMAYMAGVQGSADAMIERQAMWSNAFPIPMRSLVGLLLEHPTRVKGYLHGGFWLVYVALLVRHLRRMPPGEALFCAGALLISTQQETFQGIYRYVMPLVPLTLAIADDRPGLRTALLVLNVIFGTVMILAFVTNNRLAV